MLEKFYPTECAESVYDVDFKTLFQRGIRGIDFSISTIPLFPTALLRWQIQGIVCASARHGVSDVSAFQ